MIQPKYLQGGGNITVGPYLSILSMGQEKYSTSVLSIVK